MENGIYLGQGRHIFMEQAGQNDFYVLEAAKLGDLRPSSAVPEDKHFIFLRVTKSYTYVYKISCGELKTRNLLSHLNIRYFKWSNLVLNFFFFPHSPLNFKYCMKENRQNIYDIHWLGLAGPEILFTYFKNEWPNR